MQIWTCLISPKHPANVSVTVFLTRCDVPSRFYTTSFFGLLFFVFSVLWSFFSVLRFSIYSVLWIRTNVPTSYISMGSIACPWSKDSRTNGRNVFDNVANVAFFHDHRYRLMELEGGRQGWAADNAHVFSFCYFQNKTIFWHTIVDFSKKSFEFVKIVH